MKKSLFLAMGLTSMTAYAQYEGRVGINIETPSATLNVKSKTGTSKYTKNLELENGAGNKLVTVLDDGSFGILAEPNNDLVNIKNRIRISPDTRANGIGISALSTPWARGYNFTSIDGSTKYGGFDAYGDADNLRYFFIGNEYNNPLFRVQADTGNVTIGVSGVNIKVSEKLDVNGNARLRTLPNVKGASTDKVVVVDDTGVLKSVERSSITSTSTDPKATTTEKICDATNAGTFYYKEKTATDGKKQGVMGFCTKADDVYTWVYFINGAEVMTSSGSNKFEGL